MVSDVTSDTPTSFRAEPKRVRLRLTVKPNTVQKVAGTLRVPSAAIQKALLFEGCGTWNVPATLLL
jgi:hypothetical protein